MINYARNYTIWILIQSTIVQFILNHTITTRFGLTPFAYYEIFMLCAAWFLLTHNHRMSKMAEDLSSLRELVANVSVVYASMGFTAINKLNDIEQKIIDETSKHKG